MSVDGTLLLGIPVLYEHSHVGLSTTLYPGSGLLFLIRTFFPYCCTLLLVVLWQIRLSDSHQTLLLFVIDACMRSPLLLIIEYCWLWSVVDVVVLIDIVADDCWLYHKMLLADGHAPKSECIL